MTLPYSGDFIITKIYGEDPPAGYSYSAGTHPGIDFVGQDSKNIYAVASGTCIRSALDANGWGNYVVIQGSQYAFIYAHLKSRAVNVGEDVAEGELIGIEGNTGMSTGSHLHFEIRANYADIYSTINPATYLNLIDERGEARLATTEVVPEVEVEVQTTIDDNAPSAWAEASWEWAKEMGFLNGEKPKDYTTRQELAIVIQRVYNALK